MQKLFYSALTLMLFISLGSCKPKVKVLDPAGEKMAIDSIVTARSTAVVADVNTACEAKIAQKMQELATQDSIKKVEAAAAKKGGKK
jgi:hypothetical protein